MTLDIDIVTRLFRSILKRDPGSAEITTCAEKMKTGLDIVDIVDWLITSPEARSKISNLTFPPGHFYSPIVDTEIVSARIPRQRPAPPETLLDINIDINKMTKFYQDNLAPNIATTPFPVHPSPSHRYHFENSAYSYGDASILRAMVAHVRPKRFIEVGSGWSSACLLDTLDEFRLDTLVTFVEPYPSLLESVLRDSDRAKINIYEKPVQDVPLSLFDDLEEGDILFIDSTHVLKTGSDVVWELTEILPRLRRGVIIHFHDIFYPFEYSYEWAVTENRSWNELYALRCFLAFNSHFCVLFFNDMFAQLRYEIVNSDKNPMRKNMGGAIWLCKELGRD